MYFRVSSRPYKDRVYKSFQLVECHRHPETRKPTTWVLASLGDLSKLEEGDRMALVVSLARALGVLDVVKLDSDELRLADPGAATARARSVGAMWAILEVMRQFHIPEVWEELVAGRKNHASLARHLTALLCHRLDDPGSKLSLLNWLETVLIPGIDADDVTYQGLLRTMDVLLEHKEELEKKVTAYFRIEMRGAFLWVEPLEEAEEYAKKCDGKLALHTDNRDLGAEELHRIYKDLQEIERWWRTLKSFVKIRPTHHWTERRVRAHVFLCVLALTIERVMRLKLKAAGSEHSPRRALEELRKLMHVKLTLPSNERQYDILANKRPVQQELFRALEIDPLTDARLRRIVS